MTSVFTAEDRTRIDKFHADFAKRVAKSGSPTGDEDGYQAEIYCGAPGCAVKLERGAACGACRCAYYCGQEVLIASAPRAAVQHGLQITAKHLLVTINAQGGGQLGMQAWVAVPAQAMGKVRPHLLPRPNLTPPPPSSLFRIGYGLLVGWKP
jgi:hypothetical protein